MWAIREDGQTVELAEAGTWKLIHRNDSEGEQGFRGVKWGTDPEAAKRREDSSPADESERMLYWTGGRLGGLTCDIVYIYANHSLVRAKYIVDEVWVNENRYLMEHRGLKGLLAKKYGEPDSDDEFWSNELWKESYDDWGKAVEQGHLSMYTTWISGETRIILALDGENYSSSLSIEYSSMKLGKVEDKLKEAEVLGVL